VEFRSQQLVEHFQQASARRALLFAASAGGNCEEHARLLWQESRPDEYFFLEIFGSAVVEHLVASLSGRLCDFAEGEGFMAIPHYSPGYTGWDVADQNPLFDLMVRGAKLEFPEPIKALPSGMLKPRKSLLGLVGLAARTSETPPKVSRVPCTNCSFSPCTYRRAPYRHAPIQRENVAALNNQAATKAVNRPADRNGNYSVNPRALKKWASERVHLEPRNDGSLVASFRFDGTTCSSPGRPLAFDYTVELSAQDDGWIIRRSDCSPTRGDDGYKLMCASLNDLSALRTAMEEEKPLVNRPLSDVLSWKRAHAPSGCYCAADSRLHKWGLALEAIHFALARVEPRDVT
jgi:hypothetical protein